MKGKMYSCLFDDKTMEDSYRRQSVLKVPDFRLNPRSNYPMVFGQFSNLKSVLRHFTRLAVVAAGS